MTEGMALVRWLCHCGLLRTRPPSVLRMGAAAKRRAPAARPRTASLYGATTGLRP